MSIYDELYDWQKNIVDLYKEKKSYGIFLDCGLGKTPISLALAEANGCNKILVVTINSKAIESDTVKGSWLWWAKKSSLGYNLYNKNSKNPEFGLLGRDILVVNYESLYKRLGKDSVRKGTQLSDLISKFIRSASCSKIGIIIDESHKMKDLQSLQTKAIMKIKQESDMMSVNNTRLYLLSGTPFTTGYIDLYSQLKILGCQMNKTSFIDNFCIRGSIKGLLEWQEPIVGYKNINLLYDLVHKFGITIKSKDVIKLPDTIFNVITAPETAGFDMYTYEKLPGKMINRYAKQVIVEDKNSRVNNPFYRNINYPDLSWIADTTGTFWLRARQLSIGFQGSASSYKWFDKSRVDKLKYILENNPDNYIIFYNFTPELIEIFDVCEKLGYKVDVYSGDIKSLTFYDQYENMSKEDRVNSEKRVLIANYASGSTGKNWQLYSKCIMFSIPLYKDWEQSLARLHRIGQEETTIYYKFVGDNWLDRSMEASLSEGIQYSEKMFESDLKRVKEVIL